MAKKKFMRGLQAGFEAGAKSAMQSKESDIEKYDDKINRLTKILKAHPEDSREYVLTMRKIIELQMGVHEGIFGTDKVVKSADEVIADFDKETGAIGTKQEQVDIARLTLKEETQAHKTEAEYKKGIAKTRASTAKRNTEGILTELEGLYKSQYLIDRVKKFKDEKEEGADEPIGNTLKEFGSDWGVDVKGIDINVLTADVEYVRETDTYVSKSLDDRIASLVGQYKEITNIDLPLDKRDVRKDVEGGIDEAFKINRGTIDLSLLQSNYADLGLDITELLDPSIYPHKTKPDIALGLVEWSPLEWDKDDEKVLEAYVQKHYVENKVAATNKRLKILEFELENLLEDVYYKDRPPPPPKEEKKKWLNKENN